MLSSYFVICPDGNESVDTFRLYEALESGIYKYHFHYSNRKIGILFFKYHFHYSKIK